MPNISLQNVCFGYDDNLFNNISMSFGTADKIAIIGDNGVGKTTLLNILAGNLTHMPVIMNTRIACIWGNFFGVYIFDT